MSSLTLAAASLFTLCLSSCSSAGGVWSTASTEDVRGGHVVRVSSYGLGFINNPMDRAFFIGSRTAEFVYVGSAAPGTKAWAAGPLVGLPAGVPLASSTRLKGAQLAFSPTFVGWDCGSICRDVTRIAAGRDIVLEKHHRPRSTTSDYSIHP